MRIPHIGYREKAKSAASASDLDFAGLALLLLYLQ